MRDRPSRTQDDVEDDGTVVRPTTFRGALRERALEVAMRKRMAGVPTYSVPEAAALLSVSQEYLYRLIQAGAFPAVHMCFGGKQGRYVVPAKAVERLLDATVAAGGCVDVSEWTDRDAAGGVA